mmetsp:Transcript_17586/g.43880  ORF Transcript_17586/g.43880 Transcript_17586/m.43880 type:complete len:86 (-) Transcript_17586:1087-1344(-)
MDKKYITNATDKETVFLSNKSYRGLSRGRLQMKCMGRHDARDKSRMLLFQANSYWQVELHILSWGVMEERVKNISRQSTTNKTSA